MTAGLSKRMRIARTTNVYGRLRANRTIHMDVSLLGYGVSGRFDAAAHASSFFRRSPKPQRRFLPSLVSISFMFDAL